MLMMSNKQCKSGTSKVADFQIVKGSFLTTFGYFPDLKIIVIVNFSDSKSIIMCEHLHLPSNTTDENKECSKILFHG